MYSEPVDSISFRRFGNHRHSEPNIRWSQPVLSLVKLDFSGGVNGGGLSEDESRIETVGTGKGKIALLQRRLQEKREQQLTTKSYHRSISSSQHQISNRKSAGNVTAAGSELIVNRGVIEEKATWNSESNHTCGSVDNLLNSNIKPLVLVTPENKEGKNSNQLRKSQQISGMHAKCDQIFV